MRTAGTSNRWCEVLLGELCEPAEQTNPEKQPEKPFLYVDVSSVSNETFCINEPRQVLGKEAPSRARKVIRHNDVIFATVRPSLQRVALVPPELDGQVCSTGFCVLRPKPQRLDPAFLYFSLLTERIQRRVEGLQDGATYPAIRDSDLFEQCIPLPTVTEQRAIAEALDAVQKAKEARQRELALERERKAALMEYLFTHGTRGEPRKQTEIGQIPESWQAVPLGKVCKSSAFGPRFGAELYSENGNIAVLRTTDFDEDGNIDYATVPCAQLELEKFKSHLLEPGDFLITRSGTCGIASVFHRHSRDVIPGAFLIRFRLSSELSPEFLRHYINSATGRQRVQRIASGAIQKNLTSTSLLSFCVPLPPLIEQESVNRVAAYCNEKIWALEHEVQVLNELFGAMLDELMAGRLSAAALIREHEVR